MTDQVLVREATTAAEREAVFHLRYDVYIDDMHVFTDIADHDQQALQDEHDENSALLLASIDDMPMGTLRITYGNAVLDQEFEDNYDVSRWCPGIVDPEQVAICSKFAVRPEHRGGMVPYELLRAAVHVGINRDAELVFCDCQPHLVTLYTYLGFRSYRAAYRDPHVGSTVPLALVMRDVEHLERLSSPLLQMGLAGREPTALTRRILDNFPGETMARSAEELMAVLHQMAQPPPTPTARTSVLEGLNDEELSAVMSRGQVLTFKAGDPLIGRGHGTRTLYVVLKGEFRVVTPDGVTVGTIQEGQPVGEVAYLLRRQRMLDVITTSEQAQVIALSESTLNALIEDHGPAAGKLLHGLARTLAERLAASHA